jgi:hypothetical protein
MRNPFSDGWPPRYRVVVASPKLGRFFRIDLFWLDWSAGKEGFAPGYTSAFAGIVAARRPKTAKQVDERLANVLTGDLRVHLNKAVKETEFDNILEARLR